MGDTSQHVLSRRDRHDARIKIPDILSLEKSSGIGIVPTRPIKYSPLLANEIGGFFIKIKDVSILRNIRDFPFNENITSELKRFFVALDAYQESHHPVLERNFILFGALEGPVFAKKLKAFRTEYFIKKHGGEFFSEPAFSSGIKSDVHLYDIGQIFNYQYLIHWEEPDECDYKYGFEPVETDPEFVAKFRKEVAEVLPTNGERIDPREILMKISGSKSYLPKGPKKKVPRWVIKADTNKFQKNIGKCLRTVVPVCPSAWRDTVVTSSNALNTIQLIDEQTLTILQKMAGHIMLKDEWRIEKMLSSFFNPLKSYIHRDIRKEGITKPRYLLKIMLEELHKKYPHIEVYENVSFYEDFSLVVDDEEIFPTRGHGLGMANSLTTLMQICVMNLIIDHLQNTIGEEIEIDYLCLNDDLTVSIDAQFVDDYWVAEEEVMKGLGLIRASNKSFLLKGAFVLAERYYGAPLINTKDSYHRKEILNVLNAYNIVHAKSLLASIVHSVPTDLLLHYLREIIRYWGYEFFPDEYRYPLSCGGWVDNYLGSICLDLLTLEQLPYDKRVYKAFKGALVNSVNIHLKGPKKEFKMINNLFGNVRIPEEFKELYNDVSYSRMKSKYTRSSEHPELFKIGWDSLYKRRQEVYKKTQSVPYEAFIREYWEAFPTRDFYPIEDMISRDILVTKQRFKVSDKYISKTPLIAALSKWDCFIPYDGVPEDFSVHFLEQTENSNKTSLAVRKRLKEFVFEKVLFFQGELVEFFTYSEDPVDQQDFMRSYIDPQGLAICNTIVSVANRVPVLKEEWRRDIIKKKEDVYGRFLTPIEEMVLQPYADNHPLIKLIVANELNNEELEEFLFLLDEKKKFLELQLGYDSQNPNSNLHITWEQHLQIGRNTRIWPPGFREQIFEDQEDKMAEASSMYDDEEPLPPELEADLYQPEDGYEFDEDFFEEMLAEQEEDALSSEEDEEG